MCEGADLAREDQASDRATWDDPRRAGATSGEGRNGDRGDCPALSERDVEGKLMLREMPNGLSVWCARQAEEEAFFIYGEIFEDRTYARMGLRVRDGDTIWDVGESVVIEAPTRRTEGVPTVQWLGGVRVVFTSGPGTLLLRLRVRSTIFIVVFAIL